MDSVLMEYYLRGSSIADDRSLAHVSLLFGIKWRIIHLAAGNSQKTRDKNFLCRHMPERTSLPLIFFNIY